MKFRGGDLLQGLGCRGLRLRNDAAELLIVDQLFYSRLFAAHRTLGIFSQLEFAKLHLQSIKEEQSVYQTSLNAQNKLDCLVCLDSSNDSGQDTQHAAFGA